MENAYIAIGTIGIAMLIAVQMGFLGTKTGFVTLAVGILLLALSSLLA